MDSIWISRYLATLTLHIGVSRHLPISLSTPNFIYQKTQFLALKGYVLVDSDFPLAHHYRAVLAWSAMPEICRKSDYFYPIFQSKASLEERNLLGVKLVEKGSSSHC